MKLLLLDIGNTYTKIALYENEMINDIKRIKSNELFGSFDIDFEFDYAVISSVIKDYGNKLKDLIHMNYNKDSLVINHDLKFINKYPDNNELGSDLICIMEALSKDNKDYIALSLGTASVFMLVLNKEFSGCSIAPGLLTSLNGLINNASLLENTMLNGEYELLNHTTDKCLRSGILNGFKYLTDGFISNIIKENSNKDLKVFYFGGFSETLKELSDYKDMIIIDNDLVFKGMIEIYKMNGNK